MIGDQTILHAKQTPAVFENTDVGSGAPELQRASPLQVELRGQRLKLLPLVCSEALNVFSPTEPYDAVIVVARHDAPAGFDPLIKMNVTTQHPVVLCNDGAFGDSAIHTIHDDRMLGVWWWSPPISGRLPPGDSILIADINLEATAVQKGVANPARPASLVAAASIVADGDNAGAYTVAQELSEIAQKGDNTLQLQLLEGVQQQWNPKGLAQLVIPHAKTLAKAGVLTAESCRCLLNSDIASFVL
jgi:hypothetical protein